MANVTLYFKDPCPYCTNAKRLLTNKGVDFESIDLTSKPEELEALKNKYNYRTVPMIMINGKMIGGYMDLKELNESGELDKLLESP